MPRLGLGIGLGRNSLRKLFSPGKLPGILIERKFLESSGMAKNSAAVAHADGNLLLAPESGFQVYGGGNYKPWLANGVTVTDRYAAGPTGIAGAGTRFVTAAVNGYLSQSVSLPSGPYILSYQCRSNNGSAQNMRLGKQDVGGLAVSGNKAIPSNGDYVDCQFPFTAGSGFIGVFVMNDGASATDVSITGVRLEPGSVESPYTDGVWDMVPAPVASSGVWGSGYLDMTAANAIGAATAGAAVNLTEFAWYGIVRVTAGASYSTIVGTPGYTKTLALMASDAGVERVVAHLNGSLRAASNIANLRGNVDRVVGFIYDGAKVIIEIDGTIVASVNYTGSAIALSQLVYGDTNGIKPLPGHYVYELMWTNGSMFSGNAGLRSKVVKELRKISSSRGRTCANGKTLWIAFGDSFTEQSSSVLSQTHWTRQMSTYLAPALCDNFAKSGTTLMGAGGVNDQRIAAKAMYDYSQFDHVSAFILPGQNDLNAATRQDAAFLANLKTIYDAMRADGIRDVVVSPTLNRYVAGNQTAYDDGRAAAKLGLIPGLNCDRIFDDVPNMSANGSYTANIGDYTGDGSHLSDPVGNTGIFNAFKSKAAASILV